MINSLQKKRKEGVSEEMILIFHHTTHALFMDIFRVNFLRN